MPDPKLPPLTVGWPHDTAAPPPVAPPVAPPAPVSIRPGDLILTRAISFWDSGQLKRVVVGIGLSALPIIWDLIQKNDLTWKTGLNAILVGLFAWMGYSRAKSPDVVTKSTMLDTPATPASITAFVPAKLLADLQTREAAGKG